MNCRIVRNLVYDFVLGWDFFNRYNCSIHPKQGYLQVENDRVDLIVNSVGISSSHFSLAEDVVIPPLSKMLTAATFYIDPADNITTTDIIEVEPLRQNSAKVAVGRSIARVDNGMFMVELLNPFETSLKISSEAVLGHVSFTTEEELKGCTEETDITLSYGGEDSGYESEEVAAHDTAPTSSHSTKPAPSPSTKPPDKPKTTPLKDEEYKLDYSTVAEDAKPRLEELKNLLEVKHADVFSKSERDRGKTDVCYYQANVKPGPPIVIPPYRTTPEMQKEADRQVHDMIADGLVSHSTSPYSAPILMVKKKAPGQWRLCTDFRKINARSERVVYPLPRIDDTLQKLQKPRFFSTMDLLKGFWQVPIAPQDRKFFAFSTGNLHVEYNVMPMGAINSTATMQALMALILRGLPAEHVICFLDDILIASDTFEDHLKHIDLVLSALGRAGLKLNPQKCLFAQAEVSCLGHRLSRQGISPDPHNLNKIAKWKPPTNKSEIRSFLGLTGYYRQMIAQYARIATPLTNLTKDDAVWKWTDVEQKSFETLRDTLTSDTIMAYPDFSKPFWVKTDASKHSVGFVLTQKDGKKEKVIAYGSKKLTETQSNYCTYDREYFGILTAVRTYSHYLRHSKFYVVTDHRPLLNLRKIDPKTDATGRRVRWSIELNLYDFEVLYKKGKQHSDADALSRLTDHEDYAEEEEFAGLGEPPDNTIRNSPPHASDDEFMLMGMAESDTATIVELISQDDKRKELAEAQDADLTIHEVKQMVLHGKGIPTDYPETFYKKNFPRLVVQDNILFRKAFHGSATLPILQAVIPTTLVPDVLKDSHGSIFAGHPGHKRMNDIIQRHAVWPGLYKDIKQFVTKCPQCDLVTQPNPPVRTDLQSMDPEFVFEHVCCDLIELPAARGWKYICVFMDVFSRHVAFYKFRDKTTVSFTRALEDYVTHHGCPFKLTCDNGAEFCSELVDAATKVLGIRKRTSVVYRPQSQGMVERMNRQIIDQLTKRLKQFHHSWPEHMHYVALAHNSSPAARTGVSPNLAFFGRELPLPSFTDLSTDTLRQKYVKEYVGEMKRRVKLVHEAVRTHSKKVSAKTAEAYNRHTKHTPHNVGDLVYYKAIPKDRTKLDPKYVGPVEVIKRSATPSGEPGTRYTLRYKSGETFTRTYEQLKRVMADIKEPIHKEDLPLPPAPKISLVPFRAIIEWEKTDATPTSKGSPIATRTRSRKPHAAREARGADSPPAALTPNHVDIARHTRTSPGPAHNDTGLPVTTTPQALRPALTPPGLSPIAYLPQPAAVPVQAALATPTAATPPAITVEPATPSTEAYGISVDASLVDLPASIGDTFDLTLYDPLDPQRARLLEPASLSFDGSLERQWDRNYGAQMNNPTPNNITPQLPQEELNPYALLPDPLSTGSSPLSKETSPEASQDTVVRVPTPSPTPLARPQPSSTSSCQDSAQSDTATASTSRPPQPIAPSAIVDEPQASISTLDSARSPANLLPTPNKAKLSSSEEADFCYFLDLFSEEIQLQKGIGGKPDVAIYKGYDMRRERPSNCRDIDQWWVCRHKVKYTCDGRMKLHVKDLNDITEDSHVIEYFEHNHEPFRMSSYGHAKVSVLSRRSDNEDISDRNPTSNLSNINSGDFSGDFGSERMNDLPSSTPADDKKPEEGAIAHNSSDFTDTFIDTSRKDVHGYTIRKASRRLRGLAPIPISDAD